MTFGGLWRSHFDSRTKPEMLGRPRGISNALTGIFSFRIRSPMAPISVSEMTSVWPLLRSQTERSFNNIISAPPVFRPEMT